MLLLSSWDARARTLDDAVFRVGTEADDGIHLESLGKGERCGNPDGNYEYLAAMVNSFRADLIQRVNGK